jgi:hypothetical protein
VITRKKVRTTEYRKNCITTDSPLEALAAEKLIKAIKAVLAIPTKQASQINLLRSSDPSRLINSTTSDFGIMNSR